MGSYRVSGIGGWGSIVLVSAVLTGCNDWLNGSNDDNAPVTSLQLTGIVVDGPVVAGSVAVSDAAGTPLAETTTDGAARFFLDLPVEEAVYPLFVTVTGGTNLVTGASPDVPLLSYIESPLVTAAANATLFSTLVVGVADKMSGGLNQANLEAAKVIVRDAMSFGLDAADFDQVIAGPVADAKMPAVLKASEALAEMLRRTTAALMATGQVAASDEVLQALQADLVDGVVDGLGAPGADARTAAISHVVTAQVLLETITNTLVVNGVIAAPMLDAAIQQVLIAPDPSLTTASVLITASALQQTSDAVYTAMAVGDDPLLATISERLGSIYPDTSPDTVAAMLPVDSSLTLEPVVAYVSTTDETQLELINNRPRGKAKGWNREPIITGDPPAEVQASSLYSFVPQAADPDGDPLTFMVKGKPAWASFNSTDGRLQGMPGAKDVGTYSGIEIDVTDGTRVSALGPFEISVTSGPNGAPTISGTPPGGVTVGNRYSFQPSATDPDGDPLTFSIQGKPAWATFSTADGLLEGTPGDGEEGTYSDVSISVTDGTETRSLTAFSITVSALPNAAPEISGTPPSQVMVDANYSFVPNALDPDGDTLTFDVQNKPAWLEFNTSNGQLSGIPSGGNVGTYSSIVISASDGRDSTSLPAFEITVIPPPNQPPSISGTPPSSVTEGTQYSFTPIASDADGDALTFSIQNPPGWASFSTSTGRLQGTPTDTDVGSYDNISISVTDGQDSRSLATFSISVNALANRPPTISADIIREVTVGSTYSLTPVATDPDGDVLTFSIQNKPPWASFSTTDGRLQGTPDAADVGKYDAIRIFVSDGQESAQLTSYSITVLATATGGFTLNWDAPTSSEDGSALQDLAGYRIYMGTQSGSYPDVIEINNAGVTTYVFDNLAAGTYFMLVTAVDAAGNESLPSAEVSTTL
jgi:hypothetical protein